MRLSRPLALLFVLALCTLLACSPAPSPTPLPVVDRSAAPGASGAPAMPVPTPGHELFGFLPYWEGTKDGIVDHLADTPLTTLALFSVTHTSKGALNTKARGYRWITGDVGQRILREAQGRGTRVEIVWSSFGAKRNERLFTSPERQATVIAALVELVRQTGADGINVDVEVLDPTLVPAYGAFVRDLRAAVVAARAGGTVSAATGAGALGAAMAVAAADAGADRIFLMGYDYRVPSSSPGASAPLDRSDGGEKSLRWSLDLYAALGVPSDRLLLGLPLYGVAWPVVAPGIGMPETARGDSWIPSRNRSVITDAPVPPERDAVEQVDVYFAASDGTWGEPTPGASLAPAGTARTWTAIYVDSPQTLAPKMALANERGLAGSGFWAIGYERGLPGYRELMQRFTEGKPLP